MDINTYLHYNNVALVDPSEEFHASCINFFKTKGYLTSNQLSSLRNWAHSPETIERLTAGISSIPATTVPETVAEAPKATVTNKQWSKVDLERLFTEVESGNTSIEALAKMFNRKDTSVQNVLYRNASDCTVKKGTVLQFNRLPF